MAKTPKIRFKNFSDEWVENKLGEILIEQNNRTSNFNENPLYSLTIENGITKKTERYERDFLVKKTEDLFKIVQPNEFVTNPMNFRFGAFGYNNNKYKISVSGYYDVFSIDNNQCSHFWYAYFKTPLSLLKFNNVATGSLIEKRRVKFSTLQEIIFISPQSMAEKKQISDFFSKLDKLITLHQSKFEKLQKIKKSCLQNLFPQNNQNTPKIRFKNFTDEWLKNKLCEVAEFNPKSELPYKFEYVDLESVVGTEMISHRTEIKESAPSRAQRLAKIGDIFFQTVRPYQKNNYLFLKSDINYVFSTGYAQIRPNINATFLMSYLQTDNFVKIVLDNCTGTSYPAINSSDLSNLTVVFPLLIQEQEKIGAFFSKLDKLIALHQSKFEKLQKIKKSCLQNMFV